MAIFPVIECDSTVQVNDKFRISAEKTYKNQGEAAFTKVEIEPHTGLGFIEVQGDLTKPKPEKLWYLDYQYSSAGSKVISLKVTAGSVVTVTKTIVCVTEAEDNLFSNDDLLRELQEDVMRLLPEGRATFKYKHRAAQNFILDWLWNNGYYKVTNAGTGGAEPFVKADIVDKEFISDWATYVAMRMIYESNQSQGGDVFKQRALDFQAREERAREKFLLKIDTDGNGTLEPNEGASISSRYLQRV